MRSKSFVITFVLLALSASSALAESYSWYGSWDEGVSFGRKSSGETQYMATLRLDVRGDRVSFAHFKDGSEVATLKGKVVSRKETARGVTLELQLRSPRLKHTFALSTAALVDNNLANAFQFPGAEVGLERASGHYNVRLQVSSDGRVVDASWNGAVDSWRPQFNVQGWRPETQDGALSMFKRTVRKNASPMRIRGGFSNKNLVTTVVLGGKGKASRYVRAAPALKFRR